MIETGTAIRSEPIARNLPTIGSQASKAIKLQRMNQSMISYSANESALRLVKLSTDFSNFSSSSNRCIHRSEPRDLNRFAGSRKHLKPVSFAGTIALVCLALSADRALTQEPNEISSISGNTANQSPISDIPDTETTESPSTDVNKVDSTQNNNPLISSHQPPLSEDERTRFEEIVKELGASKFDIRESASSKLDDLDDRYLPLLNETLSKEKSPETKARLKTTVQKLEALRQARINREFITSKDQADAIRKLPGWETFSETAGLYDRKTKALFLNLLTTYPWLIDEKISSQDDAYEKAVRVANEISPRLNVAGEVTKEDGIALAYTVAMTGDKLDKGLETTSYLVFSRRPFSIDVKSTSRTATSESSNALQNFFDKFAVNAKDNYRLLMICLNAEIPVGADVGAKILSDDKAVAQPELFEGAMQAIARFGKEDKIPVVEKWLNNKTVIVQAQRTANGLGGFQAIENVEVQARDIALATTMILHRESPHILFPAYRTHNMRAYFTDSLGHPTGTSDEIRNEQLEAWKKRLETIPKLVPPS